MTKQSSTTSDTTHLVCVEEITRSYWVGGRGYVPTKMFKIYRSGNPSRYVITEHSFEMPLPEAQPRQ